MPPPLLVYYVWGHLWWGPRSNPQRTPMMINRALSLRHGGVAHEPCPTE